MRSEVAVVASIPWKVEESGRRWIVEDLYISSFYERLFG